MKAGDLTIYRVALARDLEFGDVLPKNFLPSGTPGLHLGQRTHFDLGHALEKGRGWGSPNLPIVSGLLLGSDLVDLGEWTGSFEGFTGRGIHLNPLLSFWADRGCGAKLFLGDDLGDGDATFRCLLPAGHACLHEERFERENVSHEYRPDLGRHAGRVCTTWEFDERFPCPYHGLRETHDCRVCATERSEWVEEHACEECYGLATKPDGETPCPVCDGTGYAIPEEIEEALRTGVTAWDYLEKTWT